MNEYIWPPNPSFKSEAERTVFNALVRVIPDNCVMFSNLSFYDDQYGDIEIDFVLLIPSNGAIIIEVKGGALSYNGQYWQQADRTGRRNIDAHDQVIKNQYSFKKYLQSRWSQGNLKCEWLLVFADSLIGAIQDPSIERKRIIDRSEISEIFDRAKILLYSNANHRLPPNSDWPELAFNAIKGRSLIETDRDVLLQNNREYIRKLTHERKELLSAVQGNNRILVEGPAGSGKSWLAFDQANLWATSGLKVGIATYNRGIASYHLHKSNMQELGNKIYFVGTFHDYFEKFLDSKIDINDYYRNFDAYVPKLIEIMNQEPKANKLDAWVIDEGQDFKGNWWSLLFASLKDPSEGKTAIFADKAQALSKPSEIPTAGFAKLMLKENLRNSQEIVAALNEVSEEAIVTRGPTGYEVEFKEVNDASEVIDAADEIVERLTDVEQWNVSEIALLTSKSRHPVHEEKAKDIQAYWKEYWNLDEVFYSTVQSFKGLEKSAIVLAINGVHSDVSLQSLLYIGMSRARDRLIVVGEKKYLDIMRNPKE